MSEHAPSSEIVPVHADDDRHTYVVLDPAGKVAAAGRCWLSHSAEDAIWSHVQRVSTPGIWSGVILNRDQVVRDECRLMLHDEQWSFTDVCTVAGLWAGNAELVEPKR